MTAGPETRHNALTIDVEDYYQVSAFEPYLDRADWSEQPSRLEANLDRLLELLDEVGTKATFFTLGCAAERHPASIRSLVEAGHELASHGWMHIRADRQSPDEFRDDVRRTRAVLEDVAGVRVSGYRAASFSVGADNLWVHEVLAEEGYEYSSSIFPGNHDHYGYAGAPRRPYRPLAGEFLEFPVSTVRVAGRTFPCAGGGWFRLLPYGVTRWSLQRVNQVDGLPANFYLHPWEIDPGQPKREGLDAKTRFRHYLNLHRTEPRLRRLLGDFHWAPMGAVLEEWGMLPEVFAEVAPA